ncbi:LytR/AlgR family response regulator transcription factor [Sphingobacterium paludis]|uniref:LytTR family two component transcriptional regulator n=1 Tax=Sphingobacterium paludis TaxID=1476465 RepID=A0A4R7CVP4_9SPHI|nr:response regulator transcription factor [Sphingobacterium paludis]TDS06564.1 LytTR family two component transcriptional regulator [Sphingobacterium paludis]
MKTLNLFIIDDDRSAIDHLKSLIAKTPCRLVGSATDPRNGIAEIEKKKVDIVFLDMQMEPISGLEVVPQLPNDVQVIFCTSFRESAHQAYDTYTYHYLLKPFGFVKFFNVLRKTMATITHRSFLGESETKKKFQFFGTGAKGGHERLWYEDFVYAHSLGEKTMINFTDGRSYVINQRIGRLLKRLPATHFARISNEVFIALHAIQKVLYGRVYVIIDGKEQRLDMGTEYAKEIIRWIEDNS